MWKQKKQQGAASPGPSVAESPVDEFHIKPEDQKLARRFCGLATGHCDALSLGCKLAHALRTSLPASAKDAWLSAQDGCRCFLPYKVMRRQPDKELTDWESLRAAAGVLRVVVPVVCDVLCCQRIVVQAVKTVLEAWKIPNECRDSLSIQFQAYKLRAMLSHLRRGATLGLKFQKHTDLAEIAKLMKHFPLFKQFKNTTKVT